MARIPLPIDIHIPSILKNLEKPSNFVLVASPGSGKTTRLPPSLLTCDWRKDREILVLEPRRLAAKLAALRVSEEMGENVGQTVGYHFRAESQSSAATKLRFYTEGVLLRRLLDEPRLEKVAAVVLDEFHERHFHGDMALTLLLHLQKTSRPDLRIIVMSATLDHQRLVDFLNPCAMTNLEIPSHPVTHVYQNTSSRDFLEKQVLESFKNLTREHTEIVTQNNTLVFLPGRREIERTKELFLKDGLSERYEILPLYGDLSKEEQARVFGETARKKIILATNIAESSLTLPQVRTVIDAGLRREADVSPWSGLPLLRTKLATKASCIQRAGRAGRLGPGVCSRLYSKMDFEGRPAFEAPEITRIDFAGPLLDLKALGIRSVEDLKWLDSPLPVQVEKAEKLLQQLGALDESKNLTAIGKQLSKAPTHPRWSRALFEARKFSVEDEMSHLAVIIAERKKPLHDLLDAVDTPFHLPAEQKEKRRLLQIASSWPNSPKKHEQSLEVLLAKSLLTGFVDLVGRLRKEKKILTLASGGSCQLEDVQIKKGRAFYLVVEAHSDKANAVCAIEPEWILELDPCPVVEIQKLQWDDRLQKLTALSSLAIGQVNLTEDIQVPKPSDKTFQFICEQVLKIDLEKFENAPLTEQWEYLKKDFERYYNPEDLESLTRHLGRLHFWAQAKSKTELLSQIEKNLARFLLPAFANCLSVEDVRNVEWESFLQKFLEPSEIIVFQRQVPEKFELDKGRRVTIHYNLNGKPWIESRLQDFFTLKETPQILSKKLTLHLLAPNGRAVQVTQDLQSFWKNTYPEVRKELMRRYPRHSWPEFH